MDGFYYNGGLLSGRDSLADINNSIKKQKNKEKQMMLHPADAVCR